jgi:hypothetical protein
VIQVFPRPLADGEREADRLVQGVGAGRRTAIMAEQYRQKVEAAGSVGVVNNAAVRVKINFMVR